MLCGKRDWVRKQQCPPFEGGHPKGTELPPLYRFLDAGSAETFRMRSWPASKKRRGTKSRDAGQAAGQRAL